MEAGEKKDADAQSDAEIVRLYLETAMIPDPVAASKFVGSNFELTFTGGRKFDTPTGATNFNAQRYKWVKKTIDRVETFHGNGDTIVYILGTLYQRLNPEWQQLKYFRTKWTLVRRKKCGQTKKQKRRSGSMRSGLLFSMLAVLPRSGGESERG